MPFPQDFLGCSLQYQRRLFGDWYFWKQFDHGNPHKRSLLISLQCWRKYYQNAFLLPKAMYILKKNCWVLKISLPTHHSSWIENKVKSSWGSSCWVSNSQHWSHGFLTLVLGYKRSEFTAYSKLSKSDHYEVRVAQKGYVSGVGVEVAIIIKKNKRVLWKLEQNQ